MSSPNCNVYLESDAPLGYWLKDPENLNPCVVKMIKPILPIVLTAAFVAGCSEEAGQDQVLRLQPDDKTIVGKGRRLYAEHCASCHGANLEGQNQWRVRDAEGFLPAPPHDQTGHTWHHSDAPHNESSCRAMVACLTTNACQMAPQCSSGACGPHCHAQLLLGHQTALPDIIPQRGLSFVSVLSGLDPDVDQRPPRS